MVFIPCYLLAMLAAASLAEYAIHRWWMHHRASDYYQSHSVEHHGLGMKDQHHMGYTWKQVLWILFCSCPLWLAPLFFGYWVSLVWIPFVCWWKVTWEVVHHASHDCKRSERIAAWLCPWYQHSIRHHLKHHQKVTTNFGAVFFWTDYLLGTTFPVERKA